MLLREPTYVMVVALSDDGEVMARVYGHVLHRFDATDLLLYEVDTAEAHQRKGAARAIIDFLKRLSAQRGWREMWVLTDVDNAAGNGLYRAAGGELENSPANMYVFKTGA
jgi:ribosomal protein S18 acetylase RimI-like enzyme